jgi:hypothetical protein
MRSNLVTFRSATGVVDSRRYNGFSDQLSKLSGVEATFNVVLLVRTAAARLDEEATKAEATEQKGRKRAMTFMTKTFSFVDTDTLLAKCEKIQELLYQRLCAHG